MRIISGEAGSGKTFVAVKLLLEDIMKGNKVLLCTEDPALFGHMHNIIESNNVDPSSLQWKKIDSLDPKGHLSSIIAMINQGKYKNCFSHIHFDGIHLKERDLLKVLEKLEHPNGVPTEVSVSLQTPYTGCKSVKVISHSKGSGKLEQVVSTEDLRVEFTKLGDYLKNKGEIVRG